MAIRSYHQWSEKFLKDTKLNIERLTLQNSHLNKLLCEKDRMIKGVKNEIASCDPSIDWSNWTYFSIQTPFEEWNWKEEQLEGVKERPLYESKVSQVKISHLLKQFKGSILRLKSMLEVEWSEEKGHVKIIKVNCLK